MVLSNIFSLMFQSLEMLKLHVCTKVLRQPVKYWRKQVFRFVLYLDDGFGGSYSFSEALSISIKIYKDLLVCGLTPNHNKCTWIPV